MYIIKSSGYRYIVFILNLGDKEEDVNKVDSLDYKVQRIENEADEIQIGIELLQGPKTRGPKIYEYLADTLDNLNETTDTIRRQIGAIKQLPRGGKSIAQEGNLLE